MQRPFYGPIMGPSMYGPLYPSQPFNSMNIISKILVVLIGIGLIALSVYILYRVYEYNTAPPDPATAEPAAPSVAAASAVDQAPTAVNGKTTRVIPAASVPLNSGSDYGLQFWMYIKDWDYRFGQPKYVIKRSDSTNAAIMNPNIFLNPTENNLDIAISIFGNNSADSANPAPANQTNATGDVFKLSVENVPLQTWFAVSVTCFQRNVDVYLNGKLVKSAVLPGVPRPAVGDITIAANKGFSGSVCTLKSFGSMLGPADAAAFYAAGTPCSSMPQPADTTTEPTSGATTGATTYNFLGYNFTFGITDESGKSVGTFSTIR